MNKVGGNVDSWCSKCKKMLAHTIEAMVDGMIKRVHCNTCKGAHVFRANPPNSTTKNSTKTKSEIKAKSPKSSNEYSRLMQESHDKKARSYSLKGVYEKGDLIEHSLFGLGYVVAQKDAAKIEVLFSQGTKLLIQGR